MVTEEAVPVEQMLSIIRQAVSGGVTAVQLREKTAVGNNFYEKAVQVKALLDSLSIPLIINDRVDIALAVEAAGVHLGQSDLPVKAARKIIPASMVVGVSAHTVEEAKAAEKSGADYIGAGSIFPTASKHDASLLPDGMLERIIESVSIPVVAIGGITERNASKLRSFMIDGIAVVSAITGSPNPKSAAQELLKNAYGI